MITITKTLRFDDEVLSILANDFEVDTSNGSIIGRLTCGQLDRSTYVKINKALEALGGKWSRKHVGHVFKSNPLDQLSDLLDDGTLEVAKLGWFPTPEPIVQQMVDEIGMTAMCILEPSAGEGAIADYLVSRGATKELICCVEIDQKRADILRKKGYPVSEGDFMKFYAHQKIERVFMNPPFENGQDIDHVQRAHSLLASGGALASVMSEGAFFRDDSKAVEFREWLNRVGGYSWRLPANSFQTSGTGVNARLVFIWNRITNNVNR